MNNYQNKFQAKSKLANKRDISPMSSHQPSSFKTPDQLGRKQKKVHYTESNDKYSTDITQSRKITTSDSKHFTEGKFGIEGRNITLDKKNESAVVDSDEEFLQLQARSQQQLKQLKGIAESMEEFDHFQQRQIDTGGELIKNLQEINEIVRDQIIQMDKQGRMLDKIFLDHEEKMKKNKKEKEKWVDQCNQIEVQMNDYQMQTEQLLEAQSKSLIQKIQSLHKLEFTEDFNEIKIQKVVSLSKKQEGKSNKRKNEPTEEMKVSENQDFEIKKNKKKRARNPKNDMILAESENEKPRIRHNQPKKANKPKKKYEQETKPKTELIKMRKKFQIPRSIVKEEAKQEDFYSPVIDID